VRAVLLRVVRAFTRLPLFARIWWRSPQGLDRRLLAVGLESRSAQFAHVARSGVGAVAAGRWRQVELFGGYGRDAFAVECEDDATRAFLDEELFGWRRRPQGRDLPTVITEFADRALLGLPCFVEVRFDERDGKTHFAGLNFLQPEYVRREGGRYVITPPSSASGEPRVVARSRMLDAELDLPIGLDAAQRAEVVDAYVEERILDRANANTMEAQLSPGRRGFRWDAARLRRIDTRRMYLLNAKTTHLLAASLIERQLYFYDQPPFTDYFLRWQLHDCLGRLRSVREAVLKLLDERVLRVLTEKNGLGLAHLNVVTVPSAEDEHDAYQTAQRMSERPFEYYRRATRVTSASSDESG
jgi:hypothetical protein